ncbi:MAG: cupin [Gammaproteobacteria bacterium]|uniref:Cupin n=1 Tax=SAR86 cluster bacterium TaxID=2030880 RepID=A0A520N091_9GAMM|nr:MAG: cupin [SAR86 cluster bacterium]|tara:strand:- start:6960 stop:7394 length:435 start_codon:yes stop_codon:yes gene_type:complete
MAKKYVNFRVGGVAEKKDESYTVWTNDLLTKLVASKTVIEPGMSTYGHRLLESEVIYIVITGRGFMEVVEYANTEDGHGHDPSHGIMHKDEYALAAGDVILAEEGDYVKVLNESDHDQLVYLRLFDKAGWRGRSAESDKDPQSK